MSVLAEALSVIVVRDAVQAVYPGGAEGFERDCPNQTFCADPHLLRVGFMNPYDAEAFVRGLEAVGLRFSDTGPTDICVVDQLTGPTIPCDWLAFERSEGGYSLCWLRDKPKGEMAVPSGWSPENSRGMIVIGEPAPTPDPFGLEDLLQKVRSAEQASRHLSDSDSADDARTAWRAVRRATVRVVSRAGASSMVLDHAGRALHRIYAVSGHESDLDDAANALETSLGFTGAEPRNGQIDWTLSAEFSRIVTGWVETGDIWIARLSSSRRLQAKHSRSRMIGRCTSTTLEQRCQIGLSGEAGLPGTI